MRGRRAGLAGGFDIATFVMSWAIYAVALWVAAELLDGIFLQGLRSTLIVALIFAALNYLARAVFPVGAASLLSFGLFAIVLNMALLLLTDWIVQEQDEITIHFAIDDWLDALLGGIIIAVVSTVIGMFVKPGRIRL